MVSDDLERDRELPELAAGLALRSVDAAFSICPVCAMVAIE
jgi:hypothetical protein